MSLAIVILATEDGRQWGSRRPKALHAIGGKALVAHLVATARLLVAPEEIFVAAGEHSSGVVETLKGTGARLLTDDGAVEALIGHRNLLVIPGDLALIRPETLDLLRNGLHPEDAAMIAVLAAGKRVGVCAIRSSELPARFKDVRNSNPWNACSVTELHAEMLTGGALEVRLEANDAGEILGAQSISELMAMDASLRARTAERLMLDGVTIFRPETCVFDADVEVGADTVIEPGVQLLGKTRIGSDCLIRSGTVIENSTIADGVLIRQHCIVTESEIGSGAKIGPFAHLRPGSEIGDEAHVGNFVETKKARLGKGAKANHLSYLGDAEIGAGSNIGAGVITCNYDGVHKHKTTIGAGAFVGSDSTLVAPVTIGDGAYIGAGSCITKEVPADALAVARSRQVTKEGWAANKRRQRKEEC